MYKIKCIKGIHSKDEFLIKAGEEKEVSKEIYDYYNNNFGASGNFNFTNIEGPKKVPKKVEAKKEAKKVEKSED